MGVWWGYRKIFTSIYGIFWQKLKVVSIFKIVIYHNSLQFLKWRGENWYFWVLIFFKIRPFLFLNDFFGIFFSTEVSFAVTFENMLNCYSDPVYKQMAVEFFSVLTKIMKRHPEICFIESLNVDQMLEQAIKLYAEVCKKKKYSNFFF